MIIDSHFHLDETMLTLETMIKEMDKNGIDKTALIAPFNETMFSEEETTEGKAAFDHLRQLWLDGTPDGYDIYNTFIDEKNFILGGNKYPMYPKPDNALVNKAIERYSDRFYGWITAHPKQEDVMQELETYINKRGFIGVKAHPFMHQYKINELDKVADFCVERGKPMLIHLSGEKDSYKYLSEKFPKLNVIYAHVGVPHWKEMMTYANVTPNVFVDLSSDYLSQSIVEKVVSKIDYRKLIYGCDGPYGAKGFNQYDYSEKKGWIESLNILDSQKEYILGKNFVELI
ncbi:amidohydrolase family protein [Clostridium sp. BSD9I1]|uniref:amidohydrolase family protein n=1 Tax=Clostridium sp. BSD9I1 TaxID=2003589 RepID=UPI001647DC0F|nr:amidohydrolase family protein [Clostridium sp. BSD9I1]